MSARTQPPGRLIDVGGFRLHLNAAGPAGETVVFDAALGGSLVTLSSTDPGDHRMRQQEALARLSTSGRHLVASNSTHWIPLDQPELIVAVTREIVDGRRSSRRRSET